MKKLLIGIMVMAAAAALSSCDGGYYSPDYPGSRGEAMADSPSGPMDGGGGSEGQQGRPGQAGIVTAAEWNDLDNWPFWGKLMTDPGSEQSSGYAAMSAYWQFWTDKRFAVRVTDGTNPVPGVKVELSDANTVIWTAITDNAGRADCWAGLYEEGYSSPSYSIKLNGVAQSAAPVVTSWTDEQVAMNEYTVTGAASPKAEADILFIVDATGSMMDEIDFLKDDLLDILQRGRDLDIPIAIRTGALFYRDEGDLYLTRTSPFTDNFNTTINFVKKQSADGGGDYPEAVHTALEVSLEDFDWKADARARLAFIILDAPPHHDGEQGTRFDVIFSLQKSIQTYAAKGIKLIPVASSGVDKPTEFCLRYFAIGTGGTYVFITDDSGVGDEHLVPTVGEYQIEHLNDLLVRLIQKYLQ